jgi:zinc/manganese transport system substrate-binding protein
VRRMIGATLWLVSAMILGACGPAPVADAPEPVRVLAAETFLGDMAQQVAGDRLQVQTLLPAGVDPHEYQTNPQDAIKIAESQVLIVNGLDYEAWLQNSLQAAAAGVQVVTASNGLPPAPNANPHLWMNPLNGIRYVENIRDGLSAADPGGATAYAANAETYIGQLKALDQWIRGQVDQIPQDRRLLVTNHDAIGAFADAYGFRVVGLVIPSTSTEAAPTAQEMAALIDVIRRDAVPAIFLDISESPNLADQIAQETGVKVVTGLYVETLSAPDGPAPTYVDMLKEDTTLIVDALK